MSRTLKSLGLAFLALFAISAVVASAAQATEFFHSEKEKVIVTAENTGVGMTAPHSFELTTGTGAIQCTTTKLEGTEKNASLKSETLTLTPTISGCSVAGHVMTVDTTTGKCHFKLFAATTETVAGKAHGNLEILCETGKSIDASVPDLGIVIHFPNQLIPHAYHYTNVGSGSTAEITISTTAEMNVAWTCTPKAPCLSAFGASSGTEATFLGLSTAKGFVDNNIIANEGKTGIYEEGVQQAISKGP